MSERRTPQETLEIQELLRLLDSYEAGERPLSFRDLLETSIGRYGQKTLYEEMLVSNPLRVGLSFSVTVTLCSAILALLFANSGNIVLGLLMIGPIVSGILISLWTAKSLAE